MYLHLRQVHIFHSFGALIKYVDVTLTWSKSASSGQFQFGHYMPNVPQRHILLQYILNILATLGTSPVPQPDT